jgi:hypothetical protein
MEILTAYVRDVVPRFVSGRSGFSSDVHLFPPIDVQAILIVINRRDPERIRLEPDRLNLSGAVLLGADLSGARLQRADLTAANLERADLTGAHLEGALLQEAVLRGAHLEMARLQGATLYGAEGLTQDQINASYMDAKTTLPEGVGPDGRPYYRSTRVWP